MKALERRGAGLAVVALAALLLGTSLGRLDLLNPDEGRHAEIAREMLASGHYVTPYLHGQPYGDKPVLFHWMVAASLACFGANAAAARLPSVLAALLVVALVARGLGDPRERGASRVAALLLATTPAFVALGRFVIIDMTLAATLTVALLGLGRWWLAPHPRVGSPWIFYAALGVGCLAKGPVALVLGFGVAAAFWIVDRERPSLGELRPLAGTALVLAVAAPWYLAAWFDRPEYVTGFLGDHNIGRFLGAGGFTHREPWYYYLIAVPLALLPWSVGLPRAVVDAARSASGDRQSRFLLCWIGVVVAFFSLSTTKLLTYALPAFPAFALLVGRSVAPRAGTLGLDADRRRHRGGGRRSHRLRRHRTRVRCSVAASSGARSRRRRACRLFGAAAGRRCAGAGGSRCGRGAGAVRLRSRRARHQSVRIARRCCSGRPCRAAAGRQASRLPPLAAFAGLSPRPTG